MFQGRGVPGEKTMDRVLGVFKPKQNPQEQLREWQRKLRQEVRGAERQVRDIEREQKNVEKSIRESVKRNDTASMKILAREFVRSKKAIERLHENKARLNSISMHLGENVANLKVFGNLKKSTEVMKLVNGLMKSSEVSIVMQQLEKEMLKAGLIDETVNEQLGEILDPEDIEDEIEEEIEKVLNQIVGETMDQMPTTSRRENLKQKQRVVQEERQTAELQQTAVVEGADDEAELEDIRARLANVRS